VWLRPAIQQLFRQVGGQTFRHRGSLLEVLQVVRGRSLRCDMLCGLSQNGYGNFVK